MSDVTYAPVGDTRTGSFPPGFRLPTRLAGPLAVVFQRPYARLCGRALKRLCTVNA